MVKTKIICTLGPASSTETVLRKMMVCGMDVARINCSHGSSKSNLQKIKLIRKLNKKYRRSLKILLDLEGPRIRIGDLKENIPLKKRNVFYLSKSKKQGKNMAPFDYEGPITSIRGAKYIYIDDGNIVLKVEALERRRVKTRVIVGGVLKRHKGINIPGAKLKFPKISNKDVKDIEFGMKHKVDYIAQSFVRNAEDIIEIKKILKYHNKACRLIAKIESKEGIKNINDILKVSDGVMVARGDMGVSLPIYEVPMIQKDIIRKCNKSRKFVITATQMLESMTEHLRPTRAEVTDVANAIIDGTDFLMLSGETAVGRYPVETVRMMNDIIKFTEKYTK